jgi:Hypervirulence associated proteins TUDOR domain
MTEELRKGDRVEWKTSQGEITGKVKDKLTEPTKIKKHHVAASEENPQYLVESEKTGKEAAHKPEALHKLDDN